MLVVDENRTTRGYKAVAEILALRVLAVVEPDDLEDRAEHLEGVRGLVVVARHYD